ncbi:GntP family permease [Streptomyces sp. NPDC058457]|uniref:GntP family permease n=1 Tax=Streptomyces sp. NPDC058457 TaxID=3346507 RepID=UPI003667EBEA
MAHTIGPWLLLLLVGAIGVIVVLVARLRLHPFLAITLGALGFGAAARAAGALVVPGHPVLTGLTGHLTQGFGAILGSVGLVIVFGTAIGKILERSGATVTLARAALRLCGRFHPAVGMSVMGWAVSTAIYCDSGFVVLSPVKRSVARDTGGSPVVLATALSTGLYASHTFVPPAAGPVAAAAAMGITGGGLIWLILAAVPVSVVSAGAGLYWATRWAERGESGQRGESRRPGEPGVAGKSGSDTDPDSDSYSDQNPDPDPDSASDTTSDTGPPGAHTHLVSADRPVGEVGNVGGTAGVGEVGEVGCSRPVLWRAVGPLLVPVVLMAAAAVAPLVTGGGSRAAGWPGAVLTGLRFAGTPSIALLAGLLTALALLLPERGESTLTGWLGEALADAGPVLMIVGAGGAFGAVITATPLTAYLRSLAAGHQTVTGVTALLLLFLASALVKSAQGSSTAALVITTGVFHPLLPSLGLDGRAGAVLAVLAIGAGSMVVSHINDSYFWIVARLSGMDLPTAYRAQTLGTLVQGTAALTATLALGVVLLGRF